MWRWDQGRLLYFQFDVLRSIAKVLIRFDGARIADLEYIFRKGLEQETGMPFAPSHYTVLRNYKRVFECAFLATVNDRHLIVSGFCRELSKENGFFENVDDYLLSNIKKYTHLQYKSVRECARLQAFPDEYVFTGSTARQFTQVGNAVPSLLAYKIAMQIREGF